MSPDGSIFEGKTLDDAVRKGLDALGLSRAEAMITVLAEGKGGFLGIGSRPFKVRVQSRPGGAMREPDERSEGRGGRERDRDGRRGRGGRDRDARRGGGREERRGPAEAGRRDEKRGGGERRREDDRPREGRGDRPREGDRPVEARGEARPAGERGERGRGGRGGRGGREERAGREGREPRPAREERESREPRPARGEREGREPRPAREERESREPRPARGEREGREPRPTHEERGEREGREPRPVREERESREPRPARGEREGREPRPMREERGPRPEPMAVVPPAAAFTREPEPEPMEDAAAVVGGGSASEAERGRRRRRGRRGGRGRRRDGSESPMLPGVMDEASEDVPSFETEAAPVPEADTTTEVPMIDEAPRTVVTATGYAPEVLMSNDTLAAEGRRVTEELLRHMGFDAKVEATADGDRVDVMATVSADEELLNGRKGETRQALQQLLNRMVNKGGGSQFHLQLEINDFWKDRETELADLARKLAEDALASNTEMVTEYLNSQERRIIHMTLREDARVKTYALGTGMIKRLAVAPADFPEGPRDEE